MCRVCGQIRVLHLPHALLPDAAHGQRGGRADVFAARLEALRVWLVGRPERCIALVAHAGVLSHLTGAPIRNAELRTVRAADLAVRGMGWSN